jgi:hypothetical protein
MISGVISQVRTINPLGAVGPSFCYVDADRISGAFVAFDVVVDQILSAALVPASDTFYVTMMPRVMGAAIALSDDVVLVPVLTRDQVLAPLTYFATDVLSLPSIAFLPGIISSAALYSDDMMFTPIVFTPGSLRPSLVGDLEVLFAAELASPLMLAPARLVDSDSTFAPTVFRNILIAPFVNDADVIYPAARATGWTLGAPLVTDTDAFYAPTMRMALLPGTLTDSDAIYLVSLHGGISTLQPLVSTDDDVFFAPAIANLSTTFDAGLLVNATLSNSNLTATHSSTANNSGARSAAYRTTGKYYFEVTMTTVHGNNDCVGIVTKTGTQAELVTSGHGCVATYKSAGAIFASDTASGKSLGAIAAGDVIGCAIDLTARKAWLRKNGGLWNGLALASENPGTGVGGVTIAVSVPFAPAIGFGGTGTALNDAMTANFSGAGAPSGFGAWQAVVQVLETLDGPATNVTMSSDNLTATHSTTTTGSGVRGTALKSSGKYYFEATFGATHGTNDCVGLLTWAATYANMVLNSSGGVTLYATGNGLIWTNGAASGKTLGSNVVAGDVIAVAVDLDNGKIWFRNNHGGSIGNWNGDPTANPATNTNGVAIPAGSVSPAVGFGGATVSGNIGDNISLNFGQAGYVMTAPVGFTTNWMT